MMYGSAYTRPFEHRAGRNAAKRERKRLRANPPRGTAQLWRGSARPNVLERKLAKLTRLSYGKEPRAVRRAGFRVVFWRGEWRVIDRSGNGRSLETTAVHV